jgi:hypothetical protein
MSKLGDGFNMKLTEINGHPQVVFNILGSKVDREGKYEPQLMQTFLLDWDDADRLAKALKTVSELAWAKENTKKG